jgi:hypothetical protein
MTGRGDPDAVSAGNMAGPEVVQTDETTPNL